MQRISQSYTLIYVFELELKWDKLIIYGSYTPGKLDTGSFKGQGVYTIYSKGDVETKFTHRNAIQIIKVNMIFNYL